jgi:hypothetical protein
VGLKDLFGSGRGKSKLAKHIKTATNPYTQSAERYSAMEALLDIGGQDDELAEEAYVGLLRRFTISSTKSIEDEEEKGWVYRRLGMLDKALLPAIKRFCLEHDSIAWPLRILEDIANEEEEWMVLDALLEAYPPTLDGQGTKKTQFLTHIYEIDDSRVPQILASYLADVDESVRYQVVESLIDIGEVECHEPLCKQLVDPEEDSLRLRTRILDGLAEHGWEVGEYKKAIAPVLGNEHVFDGNKIKRR